VNRATHENEPKAGPRADRASASGLLDLLAQNAMDQDYAETALRRSVGEDPEHRKGKSSKFAWAAGAALFCFALLVATTSMQRYRQADEISTSRTALTNQVKAAKQRLHNNLDQVDSLTLETQELQQARLANDNHAQELLRETEQLKARSGYTAVQGPGVKVILDDALHAAEDSQQVLDRDLQRTANGLFEAGAEAISINGQRLASLTSIRTAGHSIGVNYRPVQGPYVLSAIGDPKRLASRFAQTEGGLYMQAVKKRYGLRFDVETAKILHLPAAPLPKLISARPMASSTASGGEE